jgi:predicted GNAT family acetyltransferase
MTTSSNSRRDGEKARLDARLDEALAETFPASDPIAVSRPEGAQDAPADAPLRDNREASRFELDRGGGTAFASYRLSPGAVTITHTEVPTARRGQGIGSALVEAVLDEIRRRGLKVVPRCPFVADFIGRHHGYHDLLA